MARFRFRVLVRRLALLGVLAPGLLALAACGPSEEQKTSARKAMEQHAAILRLLPEFKSGFYVVHNIIYVNQANSIGDEKPHAIVMTIIQNDAEQGADPAKRPVLTDNRQLLRQPPEWYLTVLCPPAAMMAPYAKDFEIKVRLFSMKFNQTYPFRCRR